MNLCGEWCYRRGLVCDRNRIDAPERQFICSGSGGECINGSKFEYWEKELDRDIGPELAAPAGGQSPGTGVQGG